MNCFLLCKQYTYITHTHTESESEKDREAETDRDGTTNGTNCDTF